MLDSVYGDMGHFIRHVVILHGHNDYLVNQVICSDDEMFKTKSLAVLHAS